MREKLASFETSGLELIKSQILPNPVQENATLSVYGLSKQSANLIITNSLGSTMLSLTFDNVSEKFEYNLNLSDYTSGAYYYKIVQDGIIKTTGSFIVE